MTNRYTLDLTHMGPATGRSMRPDAAVPFLALANWQVAGHTTPIPVRQIAATDGESIERRWSLRRSWTLLRSNVSLTVLVTSLTIPRLQLYPAEAEEEGVVSELELGLTNESSPDSIDLAKGERPLCIACSTQRKSTFQYDTSVPNASVDQGYHYSVDGRRTHLSLANPAPQKRARVVGNDDLQHDEQQDDEGLWVLPGVDASELASVASTITSGDVYEHQIKEDEVGKRKRYISSDDLMRLWRDIKHVFLDHILRHDGLGEFHERPACESCDSIYPDTIRRLFRCHECGSFLQCAMCLLERHRRTPLHIVKEWMGNFWAAVALHSIEDPSLLKNDSPNDPAWKRLPVYQLGHHGHPCVRPTPGLNDKPKLLVVINANGVFTLNIRFCSCPKSLRNDAIAQLMSNAWYPAMCATFEALELFRHLNVVGNLSAHDFVGTLERRMDPTRVESVPDRYKVFSCMSRQYRFLKRAKRAGLAHEPDGWSTKDGEERKVKHGALAVKCWACPDPNFNLPHGWDQCAPEDEFLYSLMLALDANFCLKNRIRANETQDPSLGCGWGYFVENGPYKEHLQDYVAEADVSSCIAFATLMQKDTRLTMGLRVSGIGGCVCGRHGIIRAEGMGDLQKGERYANMDYILMHALGDVRVKRLVLSYDIACQWQIHLRSRVLSILDKSNIPPSLDDFHIQFVLPVWHAAAHEISCQMANSPSYAEGVGRTDGEGIERTWAVLNPISFSTKEMGKGNRRDTIEDKIDHINFEKNVGEGEVLGRKLVISTAERDKQIAEFAEVNATLSVELRRQWKQEIVDWLQDCSKANPYIMAGGKNAGPSEAEVAAQLKKAEVEALRVGRAEFMQGRTTATGFIKALLQLEDLKRRIKAEASSTQISLTAHRQGQIDELRATFFKKLTAVQRLQEEFMPAVSILRAAEEDLRDEELPPRPAEDVKLWLPSDVTHTQQSEVCSAALIDVELQLRRAQCIRSDALEKIRGHLYTKTHLVYQRNAMAVGQQASTRSSTLIGRVGDQERREVTKYRQALAALWRLKGKVLNRQCTEV
ncbi:hypothetical protein C8F01DRAFT_1305830 [Mycena amicta]|nr:hypothetical protein C8F01DRAFT_1305830 [Mycena amicta]